MWEENGCDYKEKGLYGYYSTYYNKMKYHNDISYQTVDKALLLQGFAIVGTAFLI